ncbi:MAG: pilin [Patescibacteria group bacterium]|nr:pilin [Patescibacteria group bacterium]
MRKTLFLILIFTLFTGIAHAEQFYFWVDSLDNESDPYDSLMKCEIEREEVNDNKNKVTSDECYGVEPLEFISFSPHYGEANDKITIKVRNLNKLKATDKAPLKKKIEGVYFGSIIDEDAYILKIKDKIAEIRATVPIGVEECKITVNDQVRGSVSSNKKFMISAKKEYYWYYRNQDRQIMGEDGLHDTNGFKDEDACEKGRDKYKKNTQLTALSCFPQTVEVIKEELANLSGSSTKVSGALQSITGDYNLLAPIGGLTSIDGDTDIGDYLNTIFKIIIGLCGVLAVIMIVIGGIQYMGEESIFGKSQAKNRILSAVFGLLLALGAYSLLNTIDPNLLGEKGLNVMNKVIEITGDVNAPVNTKPADVSALGIICPGDNSSSINKIARSFNGKMTYSQDIPKGQLGRNNTIKLDCSGFVNQVLKCYGFNTTSRGINTGTERMFSNPKTKAIKEIRVEQGSSSKVVYINDKLIKIGDLIGWMPGEFSNDSGHVLIYIGNGVIADCHGGGGVGKAFGAYNLSSYKYKDDLKWLIRGEKF